MSWKSVICRLSALEVARVHVLGADQKKRWTWERDWKFQGVTVKCLLVLYLWTDAKKNAMDTTIIIIIIIL